jgi:glycosyltransferase involved in cell wall biosynthesis
MSAFACEPGRGSEQEVGWRWALEMARWFDITVITQTRNRPGIERELAKGLPVDRTLSFVYFQFPSLVYRLKSQFDPLTWPYYICWQWAIRRVVAKLHKVASFDLVHHVTFVSFRVPVWLKCLGIPVVFGPVGGAEKAPRLLLRRGFRRMIQLKEIVRNTSNAVCAQMLKFFPPINGSKGICLAATPGMEKIFKNAGFPTEILPAVGIDASGKLQHAPPGAPMRFLYVGRLHSLKGVHLLLEALADLPPLQAALTIVGSGAEEGRLKALAQSLGIDSMLSWRGKMAREQLTEVYSSHDVLVAPSLYESGGLTVLEAMAVGTPAIVLDVGGHAVSVMPECGIKLSPCGSADDVILRIRDAMLMYIEQPNLVLTHGKAAQERIQSVYAWEKKAMTMKKIYERTMARFYTSSDI